MRGRWLPGALLLLFAALVGCDSGARAYERGLRKWDAGNYQEAVAELRRITREHAKSPFAPRALHKVAQIQAFDLRLTEEAEDTFRLYLKLYPDHDEADDGLHELIGLLFSTKKDYLATVTEARRYVELFPTSGRVPQMHRRVIESFIAMREFASARNEAALFLRKFPGNADADEVAYLIGQTYFIEGRPDKAVDETRRFLEERPASAWAPRARFLLAAALEDADRLAEAMVAYEQAREGYPDPAIIDGKLAAVADRLARKHK